MSIKRVMSGMRTTNKLHMGNYFGALKNWIELQKNHQCFFGAMNWHSLTSGYKTPEIFKEYVRPMIIDWLAFGIDPDKSTIYIQSEIPELLELNMIFMMLTPLPWLERVNTWKDAIDEMKQTDTYNLGRFHYPVLQTADIAIFKGQGVPVGQDQAAHLELSREIVRRFNFLYKGKLPEPATLLTETPIVLGTDGRKMSKSYGNVVPLLDEPQNIEKLTKTMVTDPARVRRTDPGDPGKCPVFSFHKLFTGEQEKQEIDTECRRAGIGCGDCKIKLAKNINSFMKEPLECQKALMANPGKVDEIIKTGCEKARKEAKSTLQEVKNNLGWPQSFI